MYILQSKCAASAYKKYFIFHFYSSQSSSSRSAELLCSIKIDEFEHPHIHMYYREDAKFDSRVSQISWIILNCVLCDKYKKCCFLTMDFV